MSNLVSVIVPYFNDLDIILDSVSRLLNIPDVEIIIVDDGSYDPLTPLVAVPDNVRLITHSRNLGVGAAFDTGVKAARGETILLMGCDVMQQEGWEKHVRRLAAEHPVGIVAAACVSVTPHNDYKIETEPRAGATLRLKQRAESRAAWFTERGYNDILLGAWLDPVPTEFTKCSCLMGASYVTTKSWYQHIHGFKLFRKWGGLEPYISIKSWLAGGYVATDPSWVVGHVYGVNGGERSPMRRRGDRIDLYYYNKLMIAHTCLPEMAAELNTFLGNPYGVGMARQLIKQSWGQIQKEREYNKSIFQRKLKEDENICYHSNV